ncbi:hypothetical protein K439DRAFT_1332067 [Ramaria rubella]|nr:hypothetical protein K439DRAFT_1332067 [Ramaria rubella]
MFSRDGSTHAEGFLLLTLENCTITTSLRPSNPPQTGTLALQCVTLDIPSNSHQDRDVWIVLQLNTFEMIVSPTQRINYSRSMHTYMFLPENESAGLVQLVVPPDPSNPLSYQDLETMEVILSQYGVVHDFESSKEKSGFVEEGSDSESTAIGGTGIGASDFKGRLVLMDEEDGEIVATLDEGIPIKEDAAVIAEGHEKDPIVIDLPSEQDENARRIGAYAHPASHEEWDMLIETAGFISRGIVLATSAIMTGMTASSNYYISRSTPTSKPIEFSPRTRTNMKRIHKISGEAVTVTSKTTGAILKTLDLLVDRVAGSDSKGTQRGRGGTNTNPIPPPLPPRGGSPPIRDRASGLPQSNLPPLSPRKPRLLNRLLACTDILLTTLEHSANQLIETGTGAVSASLTHRYGSDVGDASLMAGGSVRNVGLVYIDVRGVGRRALLRKAGKAVVRARMGGKEVVFGPQATVGAAGDNMGHITVSSPPTAPFPAYFPSAHAKGGPNGK